MDEQATSPITPQFVALDILGMFLLGLGLARQFAHVDLVPQLAAIPHYAYVLMASGCILMILAVLQLFKALRPGRR